jgi:hypothetical protein
MPEVRRIRLPQQSTLQQVLNSSVQDLLPAELAENVLVRWVVEFSNPFEDTQTDKQGVRNNREDDFWRAEMIGRMAANLVQPRVQFFFASLFHIGRMMVTSTESIDRMRRLETEENLTSSARQIQRIWRSVSDARRSRSLEFVRSSLMDSCKIGIRYQSEQGELATKWWSSWQDEVKPFRAAVITFQEECRQNQSPRRLRASTSSALMRVWASSSVSTLQEEMKRDGVKFKSAEFQSATPESYPGSAIMTMAMLSMVDDEDGHMRWHHWEHIMREWIHADRNRVDHQRSEIALQILNEKYRNTSPFDRWEVGKSHATVELRLAVLEHTLPNRMDSPWLHSWKQTLTKLSSYEAALPFPEGDDSTFRDWCVLTSDSAIKGNITDSDYTQMPWDRFIQRVFEMHWVLDLVKMSIYANAQASVSSRTWDAASVSDVVSITIRALNSIGYSLQDVAVERIDSLMKRLASGESIYSHGSW